MHPCFRGLVLNIVLDVFLPLIGIWLQGERWQLGESSLHLMNSSSSILPKRPVDTAFLPVNKTSLRSLCSVSGPRGQPPRRVRLLTTTLGLLLPALSGLWLQVLHLRVSTSVLKCPSCCIPPVCIQLSGSAVFGQLLIISNKVKTSLFALLWIH